MGGDASIPSLERPSWNSLSLPERTNSGYILLRAHRHAHPDGSTKLASASYMLLLGIGCMWSLRSHHHVGLRHGQKLVRFLANGGGTHTQDP